MEEYWYSPRDLGGFCSDDQYSGCPSKKEDNYQIDHRSNGEAVNGKSLP